MDGILGGEKGKEDFRIGGNGGGRGEGKGGVGRCVVESKEEGIKTCSGFERGEAGKGKRGYKSKEKPTEGARNYKQLGRVKGMAGGG